MSQKPVVIARTLEYIQRCEKLRQEFKELYHAGGLIGINADHIHLSTDFMSHADETPIHFTTTPGNDHYKYTINGAPCISLVIIHQREVPL